MSASRNVMGRQGLTLCQTSRDLEGWVNTGRPDWNTSALRMTATVFVQVSWDSFLEIRSAGKPYGTWHGSMSTRCHVMPCQVVIFMVKFTPYRKEICGLRKKKNNFRLKTSRFLTPCNVVKKTPTCRTDVLNNIRLETLKIYIRKIRFGLLKVRVSLS